MTRSMLTLDDCRPQGGRWRYEFAAVALALVLATRLAAAAYIAEQKLTGRSSATGDFFGRLVAIEGDTLVVIDGNAGGEELARVFRRRGGVWSERQTLTAIAAAPFDIASMALSGDYLVVGVKGGSVGARGKPGFARVFVRRGAVWTEQQKLTAADGAESEEFGFSVAVSGDTLIVGSPPRNSGGPAGPGSAYVFVGSGGVWTERQKLTRTGGDAPGEFGRSVALSRDTIVVGSPQESSGGPAGPGSAYVFARSGGVWSGQQKLMARNRVANDRFGEAAAIDGNTLVIGARGHDRGLGAAHIFVRSQGLWTEEQTLSASDRAEGDLFGLSVALGGDTLLVGAPGGNRYQGSVYHFVRTARTWREQQKLTASDGAAYELLGHSVALSGDTVVLGSHLDDVWNQNQGSAYVCSISAELLGAVLAELDGPPASDSSTTLAGGSGEIEDARARIVNVLAILAETPSSRREATAEIEEAVGELEAAVQNGLLTPAEGDRLMDPLAVVARSLAAPAIEEAIASYGDPATVGEAREALAEGDALRAAGAFKMAVNNYRDALSKAESA